MTKPAYMYIQSEPHLWTVGFESDGRWEPESDHESPEAAERRVETLNAPTLAYELRELRAENERLRAALDGHHVRGFGCAISTCKTLGRHIDG